MISIVAGGGLAVLVITFAVARELWLRSITAEHAAAGMLRR